MKINEAKTVFDLFNGHPERWIKGTMARNEKGEAIEQVPNILNKGCQFCLIGAIYFIYKFEREMEMMNRLRNVLPIPQIANWQDNPNLTFEKMLSKVKEAGI